MHLGTGTLKIHQLLQAAGQAVSSVQCHNAAGSKYPGEGSRLMLRFGLLLFNSMTTDCEGQHIVVGIATRYGAGRSGDQILVRARFFAPIKPRIKWVPGLSHG